MAPNGYFLNQRLQIVNVNLFLFRGAFQVSIGGKEQVLRATCIDFATRTLLVGTFLPRPIRIFLLSAFAFRALFCLARAVHAQAGAFFFFAKENRAIDDIFPRILLRWHARTKR